MIRPIVIAGFAMAVATSVQAMPRATPPHADSLVTQVREGCGVGRVMVAGQCVSRHDIRQARRDYYYGNGGPYGSAFGDTPAAHAVTHYDNSYGNNYGNSYGNTWGNYGYGGWNDYASRNGIVCQPGTYVRLGDGQLYHCQ
jgi:hypothetical protein